MTTYTVDVDEIFDVDRAEPVGGATHVHSGVIDVDVSHAQYVTVDAVSFPAEVDCLSVLGPRHERRRRRRLHGARQAQIDPGPENSPPLIGLRYQPRRPYNNISCVSETMTARFCSIT